MSASTNGHVQKKYNESTMAEGKLAGIKGVLHCGHLQQRLTQLKVNCLFLLSIGIPLYFK